jgi:hypothetical protein
MSSARKQSNKRDGVGIIVVKAVGMTTDQQKTNKQ